MDAQIGRLMGHLKSTGAGDNTLLVFLSDSNPEGTMWTEWPPRDRSRVSRRSAKARREGD